MTKLLPFALVALLCCVSGCGGCSKEKGAEPKAAVQPAPTRADDREYVEQLRAMGAEQNRLAAKEEKIASKLAALKADPSASPDQVKALEAELEAAKTARKDDLKAARAKIRARINKELKEQKK